MNEQSSTKTWKIRTGNPEAYFIRRIAEAPPAHGLSQEIQMAIESGQAIGIRLAGDRGIATIDAEDAAKCAKDKWFFSPGGYAARWKKYKPALLHRLIMGAKEDETRQVDHIDGNRLDSRKKNLRWATNQQNCFNCAKRNPNRRSRFLGVVPYIYKGKHRGWIAQIHGAGVEYGFVRVINEETAAKAYDVMALERYGEFARLNFPDLKERYASKTITVESLRREYHPDARLCAHCGKQFTPIRATSIFCSKRCAQLAILVKSKALRRAAPNARGKTNIGKSGHESFSSAFIGVSRRAKHSWKAMIAKGGIQYRIGPFDSERQATQGFDIKAFELYGDAAKLNFPNNLELYRHGLITIEQLSKMEIQHCESCDKPTGPKRRNARKICRRCYNIKYQADSRKQREQKSDIQSGAAI